MTTTLDLEEAAALAHCHPDTLRKMMKAGEAPGTKVGRAWVVTIEVFQKWLDDRCRSIAVLEAPIGGSALAERLASQRAQRIANKRKNLSASSSSASGESVSSVTVVPFPSTRPRRNG